MNLGKFFFKKALRDITRSNRCCHHHHDDIGSALVKVASVAAGAAIANEVVKKHYNPDGLKGAFEDLINQANGRVNSATVPMRRVPYADNVIAKLAACTYVAKIDNTITGEEQAELDMTISDILSLDNLPPVYRNEINAIRNNTDTSFSSIQPYLDRVDGNILVSYLIDIINVAKASGGISTSEQKAIDVYKNYVTKRTGCTFPEEENDVQIDLTCSGCGGTMELDNTYGRAVCPFCGNVKLIDINVVNRILGK